MAWEIVKAFFIIVAILIAVPLIGFLVLMKWDDIKDGAEELVYGAVAIGFIWLVIAAVRAIFQ